MTSENSITLEKNEVDIDSLSESERRVNPTYFTSVSNAGSNINPFQVSNIARNNIINIETSITIINFGFIRQIDSNQLENFERFENPSSTNTETQYVYTNSTIF